MAMASWRIGKTEGYTSWTGETAALSVCILPELGGKAFSLRNRLSGREWLWQSGKPLGNPGYGASFMDGDGSGWDEMFPGIDPCLYPLAPWQGSQIPDHGEVWSLAWSHHCTETSLHCSVEGKRFPYVLEKTYTFAADDTLRIDYALTNKAETPFSFLWAAHPLLNVHEGMKLLIPGAPPEIEVSYSEGGRLGGFGDKQPWPVVETAAGIIDLSDIEPEEGRFAEKYYFTGKLADGVASLFDPRAGEMLTFMFPVDRVPYLAVWANYGGFGGHYHLALEPATGRMDRLDHAIRQNEAAVVLANGVYRWHLEVKVTG